MVDSTLCAVALFCVAGSVSAQAVHSRIDADGRTTYSDRADATPSPRAAAPALEAADAPARRPRISVRQTAVIEANEAARRLKQARLTRNRGAEPLPAEREPLARFARRTLRARFAAAEAGITGVNFAIAETGSIVMEGPSEQLANYPRVKEAYLGEK